MVVDIEPDAKLTKAYRLYLFKYINLNNVNKYN